eukprot:14021285-Alexandrium_andersonii.AAC.1
MDGCRRPGGHQASTGSPMLAGPPYSWADHERGGARPLANNSPAGHGATVDLGTASARASSA